MWETVTETNNDFFILERPADGHQWNRLGKVEGVGTCNRPNTYAFTDWTPLMGMNIYRLTQVDFDGKKEQFEPVYAEFGAHEIRLFPNPADDRIILSGMDDSEALSIVVYDAMGRAVDVPLVPNGANLIISTDDLSAGPYYLIYQNGNEQAGLKFTVQH